MVDIKKCLRCNHQWTARGDVVVMCPKCKSHKWRIPKDKEEIIKEEEQVKEEEIINEDTHTDEARSIPDADGFASWKSKSIKF